MATRAASSPTSAFVRPAAETAPQGFSTPAAFPQRPESRQVSGTTAAKRGNISSIASHVQQSSLGHGKPPTLSHLPPVRLGKPLTGSSPSALRRTANPPSIVSARQTPTPFLSVAQKGLANPFRVNLPGARQTRPSVPLAAWQTPPGKASSLSSRPTTAAHQEGYRLVSLDLPPRTTRREPQPWSRHSRPCDPRVPATRSPRGPVTPGTSEEEPRPWSHRHPRPCEPRVQATRSPRGPVTPGASEDPCPTKDESIEALLGQLRPPPLLSPLKEPSPRHVPGERRKPTRPARVEAPRRPQL